MSTLSKIIPTTNMPAKFATQEIGFESRLTKTLRKIADFVTGFILAFVETVKKGFTMLFSDTLGKKEIEVIPLQKIEEKKELELGLPVQEEPEALEEKLAVEKTKEPETVDEEPVVEETEVSEDDQPIEELRLALRAREEQEADEAPAVEETKESLKTSFGLKVLNAIKNNPKTALFAAAALGTAYAVYNGHMSVRYVRASDPEQDAPLPPPVVEKDVPQTALPLKDPENPMTFCQRVQHFVTNWGCKTPEDAQTMRDKGIANLAAVGTSPEQLDAELRNVTKIKFLPEEWRDRTMRVSNGDARELYGALERVATAESYLVELSCEARAKLLSDRRNEIKEYIRRRLHPGRAEVDHLRNICKYGMEPDFLYFRGSKNCTEIINSAQKTNWLYDTLAPYWPCV